ncbi:hypothetical protein AB0H92_22185 [Streptomyces phaeochromogenes]|uniref:hypothetical protein n=1 Tax=Streptomyces phaeochromogenes TaxID=1923 RepID=UPI0033D46553
MADATPTTDGTPRAPKTPEHWNALASVIAATVSALTFLFGFIGLPAAGVDSPTATSETVTTTATVVTTATVTAPATNKEPESTGEPISSGSPRELWSGPLLFPQGDSYNLDLTPPVKEGETDLTYYGITGEREANFWHAEMAMVSQGGKPDSAECTLLVQTQAKPDITVPVGSSFCVITGAGRTALVTVKKLDTADGSVSVDAYVWDKAL